MLQTSPSSLFLEILDELVDRDSDQRALMSNAWVSKVSFFTKLEFVLCGLLWTRTDGIADVLELSEMRRAFANDLKIMRRSLEQFSIDSIL